MTRGRGCLSTTDNILGCTIDLEVSVDLFVTRVHRESNLDKGMDYQQVREASRFQRVTLIIADNWTYLGAFVDRRRNRGSFRSLL